MKPILSVIIPGYNRIEPLKYTLRSAATAASRLPVGSVEILLIDDGSNPPLSDQLRGFDPGHAVIHLVQSNQGSITARLAGLAASSGEYLHFFDSDDLVHPEKYQSLLALLDREGADIAYDDLAVATLGPDFSVATFTRAQSTAVEPNSTRFFLAVQPAPHAPVYRRSYLQESLDQPLVPVRRPMDPAGDAWLYYNLAPHPARIVKADSAHTATGPHEETRYSRCWERLGAAALLVMEAFAAACPKHPATLDARISAGEAAFHSWRRLPLDYHSQFAQRTLALWQNSPRGPVDRLGGKNFTRLAYLLGPLTAARLLRKVQSRPYDEVRTLPSSDVDAFFRQLDTLPLP